MKINQITPANGFKYLDAPQGSPEWVNLRIGRKSASRLGDWMGRGSKGAYLKPHYDYEQELMYEQLFRVPFSRFVTEAMNAGTNAEPFIKEQYEAITGRVVTPCGAFYNDDFVASPDGLVGEDGLIECKWLFDKSFIEVLAVNEPASMAHYLQIQGQLWASGRKWCDYVAANGNTKSLVIVRVERDENVIKQIAEAVAVPIPDDLLGEGIKVHRFTKELPAVNW